MEVRSMKTKNRQYMSAEDMDSWAAEQNAIACHNARTLLGELIGYATESGKDWRAPGSLEHLRRIRAQDADHGQKMRRVSEVTDAQLIEKRKELEDDFRNSKRIALYRRIGEEFTPKLSAYTVRDRFLRIRKRERGG
jgi:hypothetical protein